MSSRTAAEGARPRTIRSFVTRSGRITGAQQRALETAWPRWGIEFSPGRLDLDAVFGRTTRRVCEIGFGDGAHLAALAAAHPEQDYLGIEVHRPGVGRLLLTIEEQGLRNVRIICHDATEVFAEQLAPESLDEVLILFPDPWPKKRHHKRRLIQPAFAELLASRLRPGGMLRLATDWQPYAEHMLAVLEACPGLENAVPGGGFAERGGREPTKFERRGERLGHRVWDLVFRASAGT